MQKVICVLLLASLSRLTSPNGDAAPSVETRRASLRALLAEQWEYNLRTNPMYASVLGDKRFNDQLNDLSQEFVDRDIEQTREFLKRFEAIDTTGFPTQEKLDKELMARDLRIQLESVPFKTWEMPVSQMDGPQLWMAQLVSVLSFQTVKDYEDYTARLSKLPRLFNQSIAQMRKGMTDRLMPPGLVLEEVIGQSNGIATKAPDKTPFAHPFFNFPKTMAEEDQKRLRLQGLAAIRDSVLPAYREFTRFVREEYAPQGRNDPGIWALPNGDAFYAYQVKQSTTTSLTPEEIYQLGWAQVKEISAKMLQVAQDRGYHDVRSFTAAIADNPKLHAHSRQEILDLYQHYIDQMYPKLPLLFGRLPKAKVEVKPVEEFREKDASAAQYLAGTPDGTRPGYVMVNTGDYAKRNLIDIETTAYHEGVPGHHLQNSVAQELPSLPPFRQHEYYTAYTEGWALYAERLGEEVGLYKDPYSYYGHLGDDMLRAIRLVADTGIHYKRWTRQQVVDLFHQYSTEDEPSVQSETDRYISLPGQALGYKIGQLTFLKMRQYAKDQLRDKFDIRAFHDEVLSAGAVPMDVLEARTNEWVLMQREGTKSTSSNSSK